MILEITLPAKNANDGQRAAYRDAVALAADQLV
jgi:hypothetical protein